MIKTLNGILRYSFCFRWYTAVKTKKPNTSKQSNAQDKAGIVKQIFSRTAEHYDLMNDAISFGAHRFWKKEVARSLGIVKSNLRITRAKNNP